MLVPVFVLGGVPVLGYEPELVPYFHPCDDTEAPLFVTVGVGIVSVCPEQIADGDETLPTEGAALTVQLKLLVPDTYEEDAVGQ